MNKIIYLDAAASALKPQSVIDAETHFLTHDYANAGRGVCARAGAVDDMVCVARRRVAKFINADADQIVFTSNATDALNRVAVMSLAARQNPVVAVSDLDHHSARLPFAARGADIVVCPLDGALNIDINKLPRADIMVITAMSNVIGMPQNVSAIVAGARAKNPNVITIVDASQYVVHSAIDVKKWDADFVCFSAHKIGADTGLGIMYIKNPNAFAPDRFGGGMVRRIDDNEIIYSDAPHRFEAGTLPLTQIAGLPAAIDALESHRPDLNLIKYMYDELSKNPRIKIITPRDAALLTFVVRDMHPLDFGALAGARGICLRVGNMCATWIHRALNIDGSIRISIGSWNTMDEVRNAVHEIGEIIK